MVEWRQAATLVVIALAVLAALALTGAATADDGEQVTAAPLQPTQIVAEIPEGYNQLFPLQWAGGSLYQLKMRLATMGCIANAIWNYDSGQWRGYNQYNVPSTLNAGWLTAYGEFVSAGSLHATCFDVCEFSYFEAPRGDRTCESVAEFREKDFSGIFPYPIDDSSECTDDFDKRVQEHVLPLMPLYPDACIIRQSTPEVVSGRGTVLNPFVGISDLTYPLGPSFLTVYTNTVPPTTEAGQVVALAAEIHELCHTNQHYHVLEQMQPDRLISWSGGPSVRWRTTKPGSSFIDLVGFAHDATGDWSLPVHSSFRDLYSISPTELAAELCSLYFLDRMDEWASYELTLVDFDPGRYLTDEIVEWIETWVALPAITAAATD